MVRPIPRWAPLAPLLVLFLALQCPSFPAQEASDASGLSPEASSAREEAAAILTLPAFRHRVDTTPLERLGRAVMGVVHRSLDFLRRTVEFKYGTALATGVSMTVLAAVGLLLWRLRRRGSRLHPDADLGLPPPSGTVPERTFLPLSAAEQALSGGDPGRAAALLTDWFLCKAFEPERPPDWRTNRELLPDLRSRGPLGGGEWETLVAFHEALRYAGSPPRAATVGAWLERARRVAP